MWCHPVCRWIMVLTVALCMVPAAQAAGTYYVATDGNDSSPGTVDQPWLTLQKAGATVQPGDTVLVKSGTYRGNLVPSKSGAPGNYITFAACPGAQVVIVHNPAQEENVVNLRGKSCIVIEGFTLDGNWTGSWVEGYKGGDNNIIRNNTMIHCLRSRSGILVTLGTHWQIQNNVMRHGQPDATGAQGSDAITLRSSFHLVEGNHIVNAEHATVLAGGSNIVVRNNVLSNEYNQVVNSGGATGDGRILWENNVMVGSSIPPRDKGQAQGIQLNSQRTIIRHNIIENTYSGGVSLECYVTDHEAEDVNGNRIYNNVFFANHAGGIKVFRYQGGAIMSDNVFKNNILRRNEYASSVLRPQQLYFGDDAAGAGNCDYVVSNSWVVCNDLSATVAGAMVIGGTSQTGPDFANTLDWWQSKYPRNIFGNLDADPQFVNEDGHDFHLKAGSPMINAGAALTHTVGGGTGAELAVADAKYFCDGFGMVDSDWIKVGDGEPCRIVSIDYGRGIISLAASRTWHEGDPVNLYKDSSGNVVLAGRAPDIGAYGVPVKGEGRNRSVR